MKAFRVTNVTNLALGSRGHFLQMDETYQNRTIPVGGNIVLKAEFYELLPQYIQEWAAKNWVRLYDMTAVEGDGYIAGLRAGGEITPSSINPIKEMKGSDLIEDDEVDLTEAFEAELKTSESTGPIVESTSQMQPSVKITQALQEERHSHDLSPIPGETPKTLDDSEKFTVRAPRSKQPGSVVRTR